jgi:hypothetical protein
MVIANLASLFGSGERRNNFVGLHRQAPYTNTAKRISNGIT